jgi:hypothetical protein
MNRSIDLLTAARAEAVFASHLSAGSRPTRAVVAVAIERAVRAHGGVRGCAAEVAAAYGDYPETAARRMRWARQVVETVYPGADARSPPRAVSPTCYGGTGEACQPGL